MLLWWPWSAMIPQNSPFGTRCCTSWFHLPWELSHGSGRWPSGELGLGQLGCRCSRGLDCEEHLEQQPGWIMKKWVMWMLWVQRSILPLDERKNTRNFTDFTIQKILQTLRLRLLFSFSLWLNSIGQWKGDGDPRDSKIRKFDSQIGSFFVWGGQPCQFGCISGHWTSRVAEIVPHHCRRPSLC